MSDRDMKVWCFSGGTGFGALTNDEAGACLPPDMGPWRSVSEVTLSDARADEREAKRLIIEHGFCCFDENPNA